MKTFAEYEQFVSDSGLEMVEKGVSFATERAATDFLDEALSQGFEVTYMRMGAPGSETWIVSYIGS